MSFWDRSKEILYANGLVGEVNQNNPTPECDEANATERFIYYQINPVTTVNMNLHGSYTLPLMQRTHGIHLTVMSNLYCC